MLTDDPDSLIYRNVLVSPAYSSSKRPSVSGDNLAAVTADGLLVLPVRNPTSKQLLLRNHTLVGTAYPTTFSCSPVSQGGDEELKNCKESFNKIFKVEMDSGASSCSSDEFSSFAQNLLSSTELSGPEMSEDKVRQRTDPQLFRPIAGPDLSSVLSSWG